MAGDHTQDMRGLKAFLRAAVPYLEADRFLGPASGTISALSRGQDLTPARTLELGSGQMWYAPETVPVLSQLSLRPSPHRLPGPRPPPSHHIPPPSTTGLQRGCAQMPMAVHPAQRRHRDTPGTPALPRHLQCPCLWHRKSALARRAGWVGSGPLPQ